MGLAKHQKLSKSEYNSLTTKDEDTFYAINENGDFSEENLEDTAELYIGDKKIGGTEYDLATETADGLMSADDKIKTNAITVNKDYKSISIGYNNTNTGRYSSVIGNSNVVPNHYSFVSGLGLKTANNTQTIFGQYNSTGTTAAFQVGFGSSDTNRKNIFSVSNSGVINSDVKNFRVFTSSSDIGEYGVAIGHGSSTTESHTIALGRSSKAGRMYSVAIGNLANTSGTSSVSIGYNSSANGNYSISIGTENKTNAVDSYTMGRACTTNAQYSVALGFNNTTGVRTGDETLPYGTMTMCTPKSFVVNGETIYGVTIPKNSSLTYTYNGIEYTITNSKTTSCCLFLIQDSNNTLFKMDYTPYHAIFVHNEMTFTNNKVIEVVNIVDDIFAFLIDTQSGNTYNFIKSSTRVGLWTKTSNSNCSANGAMNLAYSSYCAGKFATAFGEQSVSGGLGSMCSGRFNYALGNYSTALGISNISTGESSCAMGYGNYTAGDYSFTSGLGNKVTHRYSTLLGSNLVSSRNAQLVVGNYNQTVSSAVFIVGNGSSDTARSNAMTVSNTGIVTANTFIGDLQGNLVNTLPVSQGGTGRTIFYADTVLTGQGTDKDTGAALPIGARNIASEITDDNVNDIPNVYAVKQAIENKSVQSLNININEDVQITSGANHEQYIYVNDIGNYIINAHFTVKTYNSSTYPEYNVKIKLISTNLETLQSTILSQTQINGNWSGIVKGQDIHNISLSGIFNIQSMLTQNTKIVIENDGQGVIDIMGNNFCQINILKIP